MVISVPGGIMSHPRKISTLILITVFFTSFILPATAESQTWLFLKNISGVGLFFENLSRHKNTSKLNIESLYDLSSDRLEKANIKVYRGSQWKNNWGGGFLKIKIVSSKFKESEQFAVYIDTAVYRPVVILGSNINKNEGVNASSWSTGKLFTCGMKEFQSCVQEGVNELLDLFINDFKVVNGVR